MIFHIDANSVVNFQGKLKSLTGILEGQISQLTFIVQLKNGRRWKRHVDYIVIFQLNLLW